jgi:DNA-binding NtrC family response regulator/tetratricopeptide (TPR) repeat protein
VSQKRSNLDQCRALLDQQRYQEVLALIDIESSITDSEKAEGLVIKSAAQIALGTYDAKVIDEALALLRLSSDLSLLARAKFLRAQVLAVRSDLMGAQEELIEAYVFFKRIEDERGMGRVSTNLANTYYMQSRFDDYFRISEQSLSHYRDLEFAPQRGMVLVNMASAHLRCGSLRQSSRKLEEAKSYRHALSNSNHYNYWHVSTMLKAQCGDLSSAVICLVNASKLPTNLRREYFRQLEISGYVYTLASEYAKAEKFLQDGEKLAYEIAPESTLVSQIKRLFGDLYILTGKFDLAEKYAFEGLAVAEKINERLEIAACYRVLAQVESQNGNGAKAREWYKKAIDLFGLISARYELAVTRYLAASSGLYEQSERIAMLYLAKEYFESEEVAPYIEKVSAELATLSAPKVTHLQTKAATSGGITVIAVSNAMRKILEKVSYIAPSDMNVLLTGETGTGKDLLAEYIHTQSGRKGKYIAVNVAALPSELMESELFGHSKGAFTNARAEKPGLMQEAHEGTLFLNEIGEAPLELQAKLLQVIETRKLRRLGETSERAVNFRLIAATNQDLAERIREGKFRSDLYHRLNQAPIVLPSLRERPEEISPLVIHFLAREGCDIASGNGELSELTRVLSDRAWPGNVRELASTIKRLWVVAGGDISRMIQIITEENHDVDEVDDLSSVLAECGGNQRKAARMLRISESTLRYRLKKIGD